MEEINPPVPPDMHLSWHIIGVVTDTDPVSVARGVASLFSDVPLNSIIAAPTVIVEDSDCYITLEYAAYENKLLPKSTYITRNTKLVRN